MSLIGLSPWIAVAGLGALHGLLPAGWLCVAACAGPTPAPAQAPAWRALIAVALGHLASLAVVAALAVLAIETGWSWPAGGTGWTAGALALVLGVLAATCRTRSRHTRVPLAPALALGVFVASCAHGSGLMLVPAWVPLCLGDGATRQIAASGSPVLILVAAALHGAAMLGAAGLGSALGRWLRARSRFARKGTYGMRSALRGLSRRFRPPA